MSNSEPASDASPKVLPRVLGLFDATAIVVGSIIGSGIFLKIGNVDKALMAWGFLPIIATWLFVGVVTLCGSLALAELAAMYPQAGGPYLYLREAYGRLPAFLWGWTEFWVVRTGSVGALACATVIYLDEFLQDGSGKSTLGHYGQMLMAVSIVVGLSIINIVSTRWGATVQNVATVAKVAFLGMLIGLPLLMGKVQFDNLNPLWVGSPEVPSEISAADPTVSAPEAPRPATLFAAFGLAMIAVFWAYDGWINVAPVAEEIREPQRNIPRALVLGIAIVAFVYVGANLSYHLVLSMPVIAKSDRLASDIFRVLFGDSGAKFAALGVLCSTFGAANSNLISGPRIYFAASRDGLVPSFIRKVHPRFETPANSIFIQGAWTTLLLVVFYLTSHKPKDAFDNITDAVICAGLIFYSLAVAAVYVLRTTRPNAERPYRTWGYPFTPALLIGTYVVALTEQIRQQAKNIAWVLVLIGVGVIYYLIVARWQSRQTKVESSIPV